MALNDTVLAMKCFLRALRGGPDQPWFTTVHPFGSLVMGLGGEDSDLDLSVTTELDPTTDASYGYGSQRTGRAKPSPKQLVTELDEELRLLLSRSQQLSDLMRVKAVPEARVPLLRLFLKSPGSPAPAKQVEHQLDITFDNTSAVKKSVRLHSLTCCT